MLVGVIHGGSAVGQRRVTRAVTVVCRGEHHGGLVCLRVLMVQVDHASAAVRRRRHAAGGGQGRDEETGQKRTCGTDS